MTSENTRNAPHHDALYLDGRSFVVFDIASEINEMFQSRRAERSWLSQELGCVPTTHGTLMFVKMIFPLHYFFFTPVKLEKITAIFFVKITRTPLSLLFWPIGISRTLI